MTKSTTKTEFQNLLWFRAPQAMALPLSGRPSGMFKLPVHGDLSFTENGLVGDTQADLAVHGGPEKAIHVLPQEHLARLADAFPDLAASLLPGVLGENLSISGLLEDEVRLGEVWSLGEVRLQVCQPRQPCWKIDDRLQMDGVTAFIDAQGITGWYCRVLTSGIAGRDSGFVREVQQTSVAPTLAEARALMREHRPSIASLRDLARTPGIADQWAQRINKRADYLARLSS